MKSFLKTITSEFIFLSWHPFWFKNGYLSGKSSGYKNRILHRGGFSYNLGYLLGSLFYSDSLEKSRSDVILENFKKNEEASFE